MLFNIYTADIPTTNSRKFIYADDIAIVTQANRFEDLEPVLNADLRILEDYFKSWYLQPNPGKTVSTTLHLSNQQAGRELNVFMYDERIPHENNPRYLGIKLDRSLTYGPHLLALRNKVKARNNIILKLTGTTWGSSAEVLRTSATALVYSTAEYCAPVWARSVHCKGLDIELNKTMRTITGCVRSTPTPWLPVLSNIAPPDLRRSQATARELNKIELRPEIPAFGDIFQPPRQRLKSRKPIWVEELNNFELARTWRERWNSIDPFINKNIIEDPNTRVPGYTLSRRVWVQQNRIRTGQGRCNYLMWKWGRRDSPECECGAAAQTVQHIVEECPLRRYLGDWTDIHEATPGAVRWLTEHNINL
jgi:hypothetical protein